MTHRVALSIAYIAVDPAGAPLDTVQAQAPPEHC